MASLMPSSSKSSIAVSPFPIAPHAYHAFILLRRDVVELVFAYLYAPNLLLPDQKHYCRTQKRQCGFSELNYNHPRVWVSDLSLDLKTLVADVVVLLSYSR